MQTQHKRIRVTGILLALGGMLTGCQLLFGDITFEPSPSSSGGNGPTAGTAGAAGMLASDCEVEGAYRCNDATLEQCEANQWSPQQSCGTAAQCDADHARCRPCEPGAIRCLAYRLEECHASGESWFLRDECASEDYCDAANARCTRCAADQAFCSGPRLNVCDETRMGWDVTLCEDANHCSTTSRSCRPCVAGEYQCSQKVLQRCNSAQEWVTADECGSDELCQATLDAKSAAEALEQPWGGNCEEPRCSERGAFRCDPNNKAQLQTCPPSLMEWEDVGEPCLTAALCDPAAGTCKDGCVPGSYKCDGARLMRCEVDGMKYVDDQLCASVTQCSASKRSCLPCVAGELQCNGARLQRCTPNQTWATLAACVTDELCLQSVKNGLSTCTPPGCTPPDSQQCGGPSNTVLQTCPASQLGWVDKEDCLTPGLCDKGLDKCIPPVCGYPGEFRCTGQKREKCDNDRKYWNVESTCESSQICDVEQGCLGQCPTVATRCNKNQVEICTTVDSPTQTPTWILRKTCATEDLCVFRDGNWTCVEPACFPKRPDDPEGRFDCTDQTVRLCNAGQTGWEVIAKCTASQICDKKAGECDNCAANTYACNGSTLSRCSEDGQEWNEIRSDCVGGCDTSADELTGNCYVCNSSNQRCSGTNQVQTCAADKTSWDAATNCANAYECHRVDSYNDYCFTCSEAGEVACVQTGSPGSTHICSEDRKSWGVASICTQGFGCVPVNGNDDYCANECEPKTVKCVDSTSLYTCSETGVGATVSECADASSLKACVSGAFSGKVACPTATPHCVAGKCVACLGTSTDCANSTTRETCDAGNWVKTACDASATPYCVGTGTCVECTSASAATCPTATTRKYCSNNSFATQTCSGNTPYCSGGSCVACTSTSAPTCISDTTRQYCSGSSWATQECTGTTSACYSGACSQCNANTPATCASDTERQYCVNGSLATETCSTGACAGGKCVGCNANSPVTCASGSALQICVNNSWEPQACPPSTPVCVGDHCVECANSDWICDSSASNLRRRCVANVAETATCTAPTPYCSSGSCVACLPDNSGCTTNQLCESGVCVDQTVSAAGASSG